MLFETAALFCVADLSGGESCVMMVSHTEQKDIVACRERVKQVQEVALEDTFDQFPTLHATVDKIACFRTPGASKLWAKSPVIVEVLKGKPLRIVEY